MSRLVTLSLLPLLLGGVLVVSAEAQITHGIAFREITVEACGQLLPPEACLDPGAIEFTDEGLFNESSTATESTVGTATASASQDSEIAIGSYSGTLMASGTADGGAAAISNADARTEYSISFTLSEATEFTATASGEIVEGAGLTSGLAELVITPFPLGMGTPIIPVQETATGVFDVTETFTLQPGDYLITAQVSVSAQGQFGPADGTATMTFDVSGPGISLDLFIRADCDGDGNFNGLLDAIQALNFQFIPGTPAPPCFEACDADGDGTFNGLLDGLRILNVQFLPGTPPPPPPYPDCGPDPDVSTTLGCDLPPAGCL